MTQQFPQITSRIDTTELKAIKNQFALRDRINSDRYELTQTERRNPQVLFDSGTPSAAITQSTMRGLKYPLELDGKGGLKLSANYDRIGEQILEILDTRIGERVYRPFFGIQEMMFETIDEYTLAQSIKSQLLSSLPVVQELEVRVTLREDGSAYIIVVYSVEGSEQAMVRYSFSL
jgi:phage baseplate assembly protein W